jgi:hypothetical protein
VIQTRIGAAVGSQFYIPRPVRTYGPIYRVAVVEATLALAVTAMVLTGTLA